MARILVEFFGEEYTENTAPLLYEDFDRVIFFSFEGERPGSRAREVIESLLPEKFGTEVFFVTVADKTLSGAYRAIYEMMRGEVRARRSEYFKNVRLCKLPRLRL